MANDLLKNPWKIDTAGAGVLTTMALRVKGIRWVGAAVAGDNAIIHDQTGRIVWESLAAGASNVESDLIESIVAWDGLIVPTLDSGVLYLDLA